VWLLTPDGFFSIVQKTGEDELCVRARDAGDLDRLRARSVPTLTETLETRGGDYRYRAWVSRDALAEGLAAIARDVDYANFRTRSRGAIPSGRRSTVVCGACSATSREAGCTVSAVDALRVAVPRAAALLDEGF
jgi:hypothetical protein